MKRGGIIDANFAGAIGRLGHTDLVVVFDAGLPMPPRPAVVDLAFRFGVPTARGASGREPIAAEEVETQNPSSSRPGFRAWTSSARGADAHGRRRESSGSYRRSHTLL
jgi:hypothetical protein